MTSKDNKDKQEFIKFFQNREYLERAVEISSYRGYDNFLNYYLCEKIDPIKYLKIRLKAKLAKKEDYSEVISALLQEIKTKDYVCVVSPFYKDKKLDGYYKRIQQADEEILNDYKKIYLDHTELGNRKFTIQHYDEQHIVIKYNSFNDAHLEAIKMITQAIRKIYIHSVHVLMPDIVDYRLLDILFNENNKTVLDLHGAVSEELKQFDTENRAKMAEFIEELAMSLSDKIVCMSQAMADYYNNKFGIPKDKLISLSILPFKGDGPSLDKPKHDRPVAVYAGGVQKWQNIDLIKEAIKQNQDKFSFRIFTHNPQQLQQDWKDIQSDHLLIDSRSNEEIYKEYLDCDFGFLLRDDTIVNNVACPTKMMEYLRFGIVPILKSDHIGNFREYGLKYVSIEDFNRGIVPDAEERKKIALSNLKIMQKITDQSNQGLKEIIEYLK